MIDEIGESIKENLKNKIISPLYGTLLSAWCVWNWKVVYITFFTKESNLLVSHGVIKMQYIENYLRTTHWVFLTVGPVISTVIMIFIISRYVAPFFYNESVRSDAQNKKSLLRYEREVEEKRSEVFGSKSEVEQGHAKMLDEQKKNIEQKKRIEELKIELINKEKESRKIEEQVKNGKSYNAGWVEEYNKFRDTGYEKYFKYFSNLIYKYNGNMDYAKRSGEGEIDSSALAYFDAAGLIEIRYGDDAGTIGRMSFTAKGSFFMKKYLEKGGDILHNDLKTNY